MLRRNSTKNKQRRPLGRSKSTNSIPRIHLFNLHSDPITAERDAHIAARLSYQRAHGRKSDGMAGIPHTTSCSFLGRSESRVSRHDFARSDGAASRQGATEGSRSLRRQQSIRFTGPNARSRRTLGSRTSDNRMTTSSSSAGFNDLEEFQRKHPRIATSEDCEDLSFLSATTNRPGVVQVSDGRLTPERSAVSLSSGYKKIRKSRSMFTTSDQTSDGQCVDFSRTEGYPLSRVSALNKENKPIAISNTPDLRAPKSMSFLRGRREQAASHTISQAENDLVAHVAGDKFQEPAENRPPLKSHPSIFFRSKTRRPDSSAGLRKSLRNSSNSSAPLSSAFSGDTLSIPKHRSLRKTARKVSRTLKTKLKGLFGRQRSSANYEDCVGTDDYSGIRDSDEESCLHLEPPPPEDASMSRGPSRIAALHAIPSNQQLRSRQGSLDSCEGVETPCADDRSRVTSWTDSVTNTVASQSALGDWERQRLSVIKENGMHMSSSTLSRVMNSQDHMIGKAVTVDSHRVYSALMKRYNVHEPCENDGDQSVDGKTLAGGTLPRDSNSNQPGFHGWIPPTIRHVRSDDDVFQDRCRDARRMSSGSLTDSSTVRKHGQEPDPSISRSGSPNPWLGQSGSRQPSPERANVNSRKGTDRNKATLHRSSAFFASPSCHLFRTKSPFRRALQENMKSEEAEEANATEKAHDTHYLGSLSEISLPTRYTSPNASEKDPRAVYAKSVYSAATDEVKVVDPIAHRYPELPTLYAHGKTSTYVSSPSGKNKGFGAREVSEASSVEWKTQLSAHVSKLEGPRPDAAWGPSQISSKLGHVREKAEIEPATMSTPPPPKTTSTPADSAPLRPVLENISPASVSKRGSRLYETMGRRENEAPRSSAGKPEMKRPSEVLERSFRTVPSLPSMNSRYLALSLADHGGDPHSPFSANSAHSSPYGERARPHHPAHMQHLGGGGSSVKSSPGLTAAVERQFGKPVGISSSSPKVKGRSTGLSPTVATPCSKIRASASQSNFYASSVATPGIKAETMGSKRMVDLFLSSRRRRIGGGTSIGDSDSSPGAFL